MTQHTLIDIPGLGPKTTVLLLNHGITTCLQLARAYDLGDGLTAAQLAEFGDRWRPWRSVASWYMWRALDMGGL